MGQLRIDFADKNKTVNIVEPIVCYHIACNLFFFFIAGNRKAVFHIRIGGRGRCIDVGIGISHENTMDGSRRTEMFCAVCAATTFNSISIK